METPETQLPDEEPAGDDVEMTVAVYTAPDQPTAELVRGALEVEGIPAVIGEQVSDMLAGPFAVGEGFWGEVRVPAQDAERARAVLEAYEREQDPAADAALAAEAEAATDPRV